VGIVASEAGSASFGSVSIAGSGVQGQAGAPTPIYASSTSSDYSDNAALAALASLPRAVSLTEILATFRE
jgi:hypothetical protein